MFSPASDCLFSPLPTAYRSPGRRASLDRGFSSNDTKPEGIKAALSLKLPKLSGGASVKSSTRSSARTRTSSYSGRSAGTDSARSSARSGGSGSDDGDDSGTEPGTQRSARSGRSVRSLRTVDTEDSATARRKRRQALYDLPDREEDDNGKTVPLKDEPPAVEPCPSFGRDVPLTPAEFPHLVVSDSTVGLWGKRITSVALSGSVAFAVSDKGQVYSWGGRDNMWTSVSNIKDQMHSAPGAAGVVRSTS